MSGTGSDSAIGGGTGPRWSVIIPYFNEAAFLPVPVRSAMAQQGTSLRLILVDNRSDDGSEAVARAVLAAAPTLEVVYLREDTPGQNHALARGFASVTTPFVAFWDADTTYPPHYLAEAERLLASGRHAVAQAIDVYADPLSAAGRRRRVRMRLTQLLLSRQGHTGSFGQCFPTPALRAAGGPLSPGWPYVLYDHELIQRVLKHGTATGSRDLWCLPSPRRSANAHVRWTLAERILYHVTPFALKDWFFYRFLGPRFERRRMVQANLRQRDW
ncbi:glycosyltransferase family 2 protein [Novosphingobium piscinae]|uniref:Glycosyltransferase family 2 protein n=1 Tax=Novosphingobium piscinae TaxID=1507448 RepID=A0A7X1FYL8_9SPHN|nr:glycosyltransferase family 2 protein [Novosphingobium piscinae]